MNNQSSTNHGGASIIPSARPSIHSHGGYCPFAQGEAMGRYGLKTHGLGSDSSLRGTDEVDNVQSKPLRSSPSPIKSNVPKRRNSHTNYLHSSNKLVSEDNGLSKSLPTNFPSYYSDDSDDNLAEESRHDSSNGTYSTVNSTPYHTPLSIHHNETAQFDASNDLPNRSFSTKYYMFFGLFILIVSCTVAYYVQEKEQNVIYNKMNFSTDLHMLGRKYNVGGDSMLKVQSGIVTIIDREDTGSFIFVYNSKSSNFQESLLNNFINDIASAAAKMLRNDSAEVQHIVLESSNLTMNNHNEFMIKYRDDVDKTGVLLVKELENIPSNLAMAFHYYCDEYNPYVKKSAIFFTMDLGNCSTYNGQGTSNAVIEKCLSTKWENVPQANIAPLLTRVVGVVVDVSPMF